MELQDLNTKHIKVIATTSVATIAVATSTAPVMAHGDNKQTADYSRNYSHSQNIGNKDKDDCIDDKQTKPSGPKSPAAPPAVPTPSGPKSPAAPPTPPKTPETPVETPKALPAVASASTDKPAELPKTGPTEVAAIGGLAAIGGYLANLLRLKRRSQQ